MFKPIEFESLGTCGTDTTKVFSIVIGKMMKKASGESKSLDHLLQKISISILRRNAACSLFICLLSMTPLRVLCSFSTERV